MKKIFRFISLLFRPSCEPELTHYHQLEMDSFTCIYDSHKLSITLYSLAVTVFSVFFLLRLCCIVMISITHNECNVDKTIMRFLRINHLNSLKLLKFKCASESLCSKCYSTIPIANNQLAGENKRIEFIETRQKLWDQLKCEYDATLASKPKEPIKVTLEYGRVHNGIAWQSTPGEIYQEINAKAYGKAIVAKVNNQLWDINRPLEGDCTVELLPFENPLAKEVLWHSAAHVLGSALETIYGCLLNTGPATNNGFFYDIHNNGKTVRKSNEIVYFQSLDLFFTSLADHTK